MIIFLSGCFLFLLFTLAIFLKLILGRKKNPHVYESAYFSNGVVAQSARQKNIKGLFPVFNYRAHHMHGSENKCYDKAA